MSTRVTARNTPAGAVPADAPGVAIALAAVPAIGVVLAVLSLDGSVVTRRPLERWPSDSAG
ncbi:MAG: hypothetical protein AAGF73_15710 [Actinomycetota bacterium]